MNAVFIAGTDTGIGKTYCATQLLSQFNAAGYSTCAMKPLATGCILTAEGELVNDDALALQGAASIKRVYADVNPYAFQLPIAPELAANAVGRRLTVAEVAQKIRDFIDSAADITIIEGVGGWAVPLNEHELVADVVRTLKLPTILVVGVRLGCLNHALLTSDSILRSGVPFVGWIANCLDPALPMPEGVIASLSQWIPRPCLGILPFESRDDSLQGHFSLKTTVLSKHPKDLAPNLDAKLGAIT